MRLVLDASLVLKWFVGAHEPGLPVAEALLHEVIRRPDDFAAPVLLSYELHSSLCRRLHAAPDVDRCMREFYALGVQLVQPDETLMSRASEIALRHRLTGYDAAHVALAQLLSGQWLTFDAQAAKRVKQLRCVRLLAT